MQYKRLAILLGLCFLPGLLLIITLLPTPNRDRFQAAASDVNWRMRQPDDSNDVNAPAISFIENTSATCSRPRPGTGQCAITWNYMSVTAASSSYIISMTVAIDNQIRAYHSGFFQNSMAFPGTMLGDGFQVVCGFPQGNTGFGNSYSYTVRARETSGLSSANYGSVTCPADVVKVYLPAVLKN
ncbi:MAG: hypothetical protein R3D55_22775 [Chloroflexota bacterium]